MPQHFILILWGIMASVGTLIFLHASIQSLKLQRELDMRRGLKKTSMLALILLVVVSLVWLGALWWAVLTI